MATAEVALTRDDALPNLPPTSRRALADIGFSKPGPGGPVWILHLHAIADLGTVPPSKFRTLLAELAPGHRQIHVRLLESGPLAMEVGNIVSYAHTLHARCAVAAEDDDARIGHVIVLMADADAVLVDALGNSLTRTDLAL